MRKQQEKSLLLSPAAKNFVRFDSGQNNQEKLILFGDPEMLRVLKNSNFWLADWTFKNTLKTFINFLLYILGVTPSGKYNFLPNKTEKNILSFLRSPKNATPESV